jgi:DNA polymerase-3 subunit alpha
MEELLKETYGITVYQEQVCCLHKNWLTLAKAMRMYCVRAMGKKQKSVLDKMKSQFIDNAKKKGYGEYTLQKIWTDWEAFAQYAFNKSHSTCYAM